MLFAGQWAKLIPLASLGGILVIVSYNMSEWRTFMSITRGPRGDVLVLLSTFFLAITVSLTVAVEIGMIMAMFLFMRRMSKLTNISVIDANVSDEEENEEAETVKINMGLPKGMLIYEVNGPLFFGASHKFKDAMYEMKSMPKVLIVRMRNVSTIDATGMHYFKEMIKGFQSQKVKVIISGVKPDIFQRLRDARIVFLVGRRNVFDNYCDALNHGKSLL